MQHGVPGTGVTLRLGKLWSHNITLTTRLVDAVTTPLLLQAVMAGQLKPKPLSTHHFPLGEINKAYDTFGNAGRERALKVILTNESASGGNTPYSDLELRATILVKGRN